MPRKSVSNARSITAHRSSSPARLSAVTKQAAATVSRSSCTSPPCSCRPEARPGAADPPRAFFIWFVLVRLAPAISEACIVLDLFERRIEGAELGTEALDGGSHVGPVAVRPLAGDEAFMAQAVIDGAVGEEVTWPGCQQLDNLVLTDGETEIDAVPKGPRAVELEVAAGHDFLGGFDLAAFDEGCGKLQGAERRVGIDAPIDHVGAIVRLRRRQAIDEDDGSVGLLGVERVPRARQAAIDDDNVGINVGCRRSIERGSIQHLDGKAQAQQPVARFQVCIGYDAKWSWRAQCMLL